MNSAEININNLACSKNTHLIVEYSIQKFADFRKSQFLNTNKNAPLKQPTPHTTSPALLPHLHKNPDVLLKFVL